MIIGIAGSFGAGKGVVVDYLVQTKGFKHYSASGFITEEIKRRGLPTDRDAMTIVANDLRKQYGPSHIIETLYQRANEMSGNTIIESLRAVAEVRKIKELGGKVIGVDADPKLRYERAHLRGSEKDNVSYERFLAQELAESNPDDPTKQDVFNALKESDRIITNNGTLEELHAQIDAVLEEITK
ncbi:MAG: AAA family ATPase [Candidatus Paceibacterota bacterium]|jgi:dephospho-CoA kinase